MEHTMLAMKITRKTWAIASALLSSEFVDRPFEQVNGGYVVLNVPTTSYNEGHGIGVVLIQNAYYDKKDLERHFFWKKDEKKNNLFFPLQKQEKYVPQKNGPRVSYNPPARRYVNR